TPCAPTCLVQDRKKVLNSSQRSEYPYYLPRLRKAPFLLFREDQFAVQGYIKNATAAFYKAPRKIQLFLEFRRQTDGLWFIISHPTIFDRYFHLSPPDLCLFAITSYNKASLAINVHIIEFIIAFVPPWSLQLLKGAFEY